MSDLNLHSGNLPLQVASRDTRHVTLINRLVKEHAVNDSLPTIMSTTIIELSTQSQWKASIKSTVTLIVINKVCMCRIHCIIVLSEFAYFKYLKPVKKTLLEIAL